jgi:hypothetical protein
VTAADVSKNRKAWKGVHAAAAQRLAHFGGVLAWSEVRHEVLRWVHADLVLIFYPHKTTAGNYHVRVRAGRCADRKLLRKCVMALAENTCNFQFPTEPAFHEEGVRQAVTENRPITN